MGLVPHTWGAGDGACAGRGSYRPDRSQGREKMRGSRRLGGGHILPYSGWEETRMTWRLQSAALNDTRFLCRGSRLCLLFRGLRVLWFSRCSGAEQISGSRPISEQTNPQ